MAVDIILWFWVCCYCAVIVLFVHDGKKAKVKRQQLWTETKAKLDAEAERQKGLDLCVGYLTEEDRQFLVFHGAGLDWIKALRKPEDAVLIEMHPPGSAELVEHQVPESIPEPEKVEDDLNLDGFFDEPLMRDSRPFRPGSGAITSLPALGRIPSTSARQIWADAQRNYENRHILHEQNFCGSNITLVTDMSDPGQRAIREKLYAKATQTQWLAQHNRTLELMRLAKEMQKRVA